MATLPHPAAGTVEHTGDDLSLTMEPGEVWWGGAAEDGARMPLGREAWSRDLGHPVPDAHGEGAASNQASPLLVSTAGRVVWSDRPFAYEVAGGHLHLVGRDITVSRCGTTLRQAFQAASQAYFPPDGAMPAPLLFTGPQYNTWIEIPHTPTQQSVLAFARRLLEAGMAPGVVIIDDNWAMDYGTWVFDRARFPDPAAMVAQLHEWGCGVMLWVVPFVSPDSRTFRSLEERGLLLRDAAGRTAVRRWWNGLSALLDLTNPGAVAWMTEQLDALVTQMGIDGFKFDAGDVRDYRADDQTCVPAEPVDQCEAWARLGAGYPYNEFRACWRMGGRALGQRLQDKPPVWGPRGLGSLIPELLTQAMMGYAFTCPDMVGGGEIVSMSAAGGVDQEFFVRYAQLAALAPMIQFSVSPARVLDDLHAAAVARALETRGAHLPLIMELAAAAAQTGEPILRPMAYHAAGMETVTDQFFLGPDVIVAPVTVQGAAERTVALPPGRWRSDDGQIYEIPTLTPPPAHQPQGPQPAGAQPPAHQRPTHQPVGTQPPAHQLAGALRQIAPTVVTVSTPLDRLPHFTRLPT